MIQVYFLSKSKLQKIQSLFCIWLNKDDITFWVYLHHGLDFIQSWCFLVTCSWENKGRLMNWVRVIILSSNRGPYCACLNGRSFQFRGGKVLCGQSSREIKKIHIRPRIQILTIPSVLRTFRFCSRYISTETSKIKREKMITFSCILLSKWRINTSFVSRCIIYFLLTTSITIIRPAKVYLFQLVPRAEFSSFVILQSISRLIHNKPFLRK